MQRSLEVAIELAAELVERRGEGREAGVELLAHPHPLRALAGEDERELALAPGGAGDEARGLLAAGERVEGGEEGVAVGADDRGTLLELRAGSASEKATSSGSSSGLLAQVRVQGGKPARASACSL